MAKPFHRARTSEQQAALRSYFQQLLASYSRPKGKDSGYGTPEREVAHFRREYEHMPLSQLWYSVRSKEGNWYLIRQNGPAYKTPIVLGRDVLAAARIWRQERDRWVQQWLAEAQQRFGLAMLPASFPDGDPHAKPETYGDVVPGVPKQWLEATWEWPEMDWTRETPGVFQVYEHDLAELRRLPHNLDGVGSCEPEEFEVMKLPDLAALSRILLAIYDHYGSDSPLTRSKEVVGDQVEEEERHGGPIYPVFYTLIAIDCRSWLQEEVGND